LKIKKFFLNIETILVIFYKNFQNLKKILITNGM